jgi:GNAT superfamily N-acetyltransferase
LLYDIWIQRSCEGWADIVHVADLEGEPVGFISCHLDAALARGRIGLVGVSSLVQGRGIGSELVRSAMRWFAEQGAKHVEVATQGRNRAAQRLYEREGFRLQQLRLWYHKWYRLPEESRI